MLKQVKDLIYLEANISLWGLSKRTNGKCYGPSLLLCIFVGAGGSDAHTSTHTSPLCPNALVGHLGSCSVMV